MGYILINISDKSQNVPYMLNIKVNYFIREVDISSYDKEVMKRIEDKVLKDIIRQHLLN